MKLPLGHYESFQIWCLAPVYTLYAHSAHEMNKNSDVMFQLTDYTVDSDWVVSENLKSILL
jgi:hypothetical protein